MRIVTFSTIISIALIIVLSATIQVSYAGAGPGILSVVPLVAPVDTPADIYIEVPATGSHIVVTRWEILRPDGTVDGNNIVPGMDVLPGERLLVVKYFRTNLAGTYTVTVFFDPINKTTFIRQAPVGGFVVPVDKFGLLAPYIGLASTTIIAAVATAIYVKRVKRRKENQ